MKYEVRMAASAEAELTAVVDWYARRSRSVALRLQAAVLTLQRSLGELPLRWGEFAPGYRRGFVRGFPY